MEWDIQEITKLVEFINSELNKGRTMINIEKENFNVNERVIHKRLIRLGYKKINNQYTNVDIIQEYNKNIIQTTTKTHQKTSKSDRVEDLDINILLELQGLIEPIKAVIQEYNKNINIIDIPNNELKITKPITEVKQKLFKIDVDVLAEWEKFVKNNNQFKVQDLISLALEEFIQKYN